MLQCPLGSSPPCKQNGVVSQSAVQNRGEELQVNSGAVGLASYCTRWCPEDLLMELILFVSIHFPSLSQDQTDLGLEESGILTALSSNALGQQPKYLVEAGSTT
jgi:hypothetical protein